MQRREFLAALTAAAVTPSLAASGEDRRNSAALVADPGELLDLPRGFSYRIVSRAGTAMDDGFVVPGRHDGMAAFADSNGRIRLVCNHENKITYQDEAAFSRTGTDLPDSVLSKFYDRGRNRTPGAGGTTTTIYDPATGRTEAQFLSLAGTEINCAGGPTPWGSWLSCEECFTDPGSVLTMAGPMFRERRHGYVFEVASGADGLVEPRPLVAMGRFEHEACAVVDDIVYMTEDRHHSLFYRFIPEAPGKLAAGGRLQALVLDGLPSQRTHNWSARRDIETDVPYDAHWLDLDDVDPDKNELRLVGAKAGAATFARGEGLCLAGDSMAFSCTIGGPDRLGQVFRYTPDAGDRDRGTLRLIAESTEDSVLHNADNMTMAPWGDLLVCEDLVGGGYCGVVGVREDGSQYRLAHAAYAPSEMTGVCFSPDGETMFVNIQKPGMTFAITGPWESLYA